MGPKKNKDKEDKEGSEIGTEDFMNNPDQQQIFELEQKLNKASADVKDLIRENEKLEELLRRRAADAEQEKEDFQFRINGMQREKDNLINQMQDLRQSLANERADIRDGIPDRPSRGFAPFEHMTRQPQYGPSKYEIPLPRQMLFDGKSTWESFIQPFRSLADSCHWDDRERAFRLTSSLRGEAAEYAFGQLDPMVLSSYSLLENALAVRYRERRTGASYLAELEKRKLGNKEKLAEYVSDIKRLVLKGYPTADSTTRETINLRYFLKGLSDQQMAVAVGMKDPKTIDEARDILETYNSLRDEVTKGPRVQMVSAKAKADEKGSVGKGRDNRFVTEARLQAFAEELKSSWEKKLDEIGSQIKDLSHGGKNQFPHAEKKEDWDSPTGGNWPTNRPRRFDRSTMECYRCHELGHMARECTKQGGENWEQVPKTSAEN